MTKIQWTDKTWNVVTGCTKCSPGCENCYAEAYARRLQANPKTKEKYRNGFGVTFHEDVLEEPLRWKKPRKVFVCSMGDLFHEEVPFSFVADVMGTIRSTPQHTYLMLTKRPRNMKQFFENRRDEMPSNIWLGVTVCNQAEANEKIPVLLGIPATVRFVSVEPMLEEIDLTPYFIQFMCVACRFETISHVKSFVCPKCKQQHLGSMYFSPALDWLIVGGETGANARPMNPDWARALRDQCKETGTPFFFKQMAKKQPIPEDLLIREFPKGGSEL